MNPRDVPGRRTYDATIARNAWEPELIAAELMRLADAHASMASESTDRDAAFDKRMTVLESRFDDTVTSLKRGATALFFAFVGGLITLLIQAGVYQERIATMQRDLQTVVQDVRAMRANIQR